MIRQRLTFVAMQGLGECADVRIGDERSRGISGGQRKRTNMCARLALLIPG